MPVKKMIVLDGGYVASKSFYDHIASLIKEVIHLLKPEPSYTAEMLCGPEFWHQLEKGEPSLAGRCVADMVSKGTLPLQIDGCKHKYPKRYTLKN